MIRKQTETRHQPWNRTKKCEEFLWQNFTISSFELVDDFVCLHSVYSGIDGRVRINGVWPFISCMQSVLANKKSDDTKIHEKYLLSIYVFDYFQSLVMLLSKHNIAKALTLLKLTNEFILSAYLVSRSYEINALPCVYTNIKFSSAVLRYFVFIRAQQVVGNLFKEFLKYLRFSPEGRITSCDERNLFLR